MKRIGERLAVSGPPGLDSIGQHNGDAGCDHRMVQSAKYDTGRLRRIRPEDLVKTRLVYSSHWPIPSSTAGVNFIERGRPRSLPFCG
jgi:hypothetical protein